VGLISAIYRSTASVARGIHENDRQWRTNRRRSDRRARKELHRELLLRLGASSSAGTREAGLVVETGKRDSQPFRARREGDGLKAAATGQRCQEAPKPKPLT